MRKYCVINIAEREAKKVVAVKINNFINDNKLKCRQIKNILKVAMCRITAIKQMSLSRFDVEELEGFLVKLKEVRDE